MDLLRQRLDALGEPLILFGQRGVRLEQRVQLLALLLGDRLAFEAGLGKRLAMLGVGLGERLVTIGLTGLCQQDERSGVGRLEGESEVEQNERVDVP